LLSLSREAEEGYRQMAMAGFSASLIASIMAGVATHLADPTAALWFTIGSGVGLVCGSVMFALAKTALVFARILRAQIRSFVFSGEDVPESLERFARVRRPGCAGWCFGSVEFVPCVEWWDGLRNPAAERAFARMGESAFFTSQILNVWGRVLLVVGFIVLGVALQIVIDDLGSSADADTRMRHVQWVAATLVIGVGLRVLLQGMAARRDGQLFLGLLQLASADASHECDDALVHEYDTLRVCTTQPPRLLYGFLRVAVR